MRSKAALPELEARFSTTASRCSGDVAGVHGKRSEEAAPASVPKDTSATPRRTSRLSTRRLARQLEDLVLLKSIVRAGSINKAARHLRISQSALSRRVERLEYSFGFNLLSRSANGVRYIAGVEGLEHYLSSIETSIDAMARWIDLRRKS